MKFENLNLKIKNRNKTGRNIPLVHVYTGDGKGKTTAAIGLAVRAAGAGMKVAFYQFLKGGKFPCYEEKALKTIRTLKFVRFKQQAPLFDKGVDRKKLKAQVAKDWEMVKAAVKSGRHGVVVLDEVIHAINLGLLSRRDVLLTINNQPSTINLVLTGRSAPAWLTKRADLVTEMKEIKHYYKKGIKAKKGIEF